MGKNKLLELLQSVDRCMATGEYNKFAPDSKPLWDETHQRVQEEIVKLTAVPIKYGGLITKMVWGVHMWERTRSS